MGRYVDLASWTRREQFEFFRGFQQPFFNICAEVDVTALRAHCRTSGASFSLAGWFACQGAINEVEALRMRLRGDRVWVHDRIRISMTVPVEDGTFQFCHLPHCETFAEFVEAAGVARGATTTGAMDDRPDDDAVVHGTTIPWVRFTSMQHARRREADVAIPKIALGKFGPSGDRVMMPVSIETHHALVDGVHVGAWFDALQRRLDAPAALLG